MTAQRKGWWIWLKMGVGGAIVLLVGRRFALDLAQPELYRETVSPGWLVAAGILYLGGLGMACLYWGWLLARVGPPPEPWNLARAYYLGQLGKYLPGKAIALVMRGAMARQAGVSPGVAGMTAFYEVLTTMTAGALLAAGVFLVETLADSTGRNAEPWSEAWEALVHLQPPEQGLSRAALLVIALVLVTACGWPLWPGLFNRLSARLSLPFRTPGSDLPRIRGGHLAMGLGLGCVGWSLMGLSLACALASVQQAGLPWTLPTLADLAASLAISYVAGFLVLVAPGGLGVRELFLTWLLTPSVAAAGALSPELARGKVVLVVLLLRLAWTLAEVLLAFLLYWIRGKP